MGEDPALVKWPVPFVVLASVVTAASAGYGSNLAASPVPSVSCGALVYGGAGEPQFLIVSDLPLRNPPGGREQVAGIKYMLAAAHYRAGKYTVGYQSCDDSSAAANGRDTAVCTANAKAYAAEPSVLGVIGPYNSECASIEIPIADAAPHGPLAMIGTATTNPELTTRIPGGDPGTPGSLYPANVRNFVRLAAPDQYQAAAAAMFAHERRLKRVVVLDDGEPYGQNIARWFVQDARKLGVRVIRSDSWDPRKPRYAALTARIRAARPDGVYLSGYAFLHGTVVLKELRLALGDRVVILAPDGFADTQENVHEAGAQADGLYFEWAYVPTQAAGPLGRKILRRSGPEPSGQFQYGALYGAAAAAALLDAIAASDGSRGSVTRELFKAATPTGIMGRITFNRNGDPDPGAVALYRIKRARPQLVRTLYPRATFAEG